MRANAHRRVSSDPAVKNYCEWLFVWMPVHGWLVAASAVGVARRFGPLPCHRDIQKQPHWSDDDFDSRVVSLSKASRAGLPVENASRTARGYDRPRCRLCVLTLCPERRCPQRQRGLSSIPSPPPEASPDKVAARLPKSVGETLLPESQLAELIGLDVVVPRERERAERVTRRISDRETGQPEQGGPPPCISGFGDGGRIVFVCVSRSACNLASRGRGDSACLPRRPVFSTAGSSMVTTG